MNDSRNMARGWDDDQDGQFFRITSSCFSPSFCFGAGVLLASYDSHEEFEPSQAVSDPTLPTKELFVFQPSA